jgi:putative tryptophan/tyrosine transport system substrate-binding protein
MTPFWILDTSTQLSTGFGFSIGRIKRTSVFIFVLSTLLVALCFPVEAQQSMKLYRIGYLAAGEPSVNEGFRQGLRELNYVEGKNIVIEARFAAGKLDRLADLAAELVRLRVDVIVTPGGTSTRAASAATRTIPIVMGAVGDPVGDGFVANLAHPGGNITGLTSIGPDLVGKRLELLKEAVPKAGRVAVLLVHPTNTPAFKEAEVAASALGLKLQPVEAHDANEIDRAFEAAASGRAGAVLVLRNPITTAHRKKVIGVAAKRRLPIMYEERAWVEIGGLMSYAPAFDDLYRRAAIYVDKILKGAKPAELPVEQPTKFELVINLKTAKQIGLTLPPSVLYRADRVIR